MISNSNIPIEQELLRKGIHMSSLAIPLIYIYVSKETALATLIPLAILTIIIDIFSRKNMFLHNFIFKYFSRMLRPHELQGGFVLNGASWVLLSAVICVAIFPKLPMVVGFTILIISDVSAALVGRNIGRTPLFDKSMEGTIAFIISAIVVIMIYGFFFNAPWTFYTTGIIGAVVAAFAEAASSLMKMDDNLTIPLSFGIVFWLGGFLSQNMGVPFLNLI